MKKTCDLFYLLLALLLLNLSACSDDKPGEELAAFEVIVNGADNVARTTCTVSCKFSGTLSNISEYGVKYSTSYNFPAGSTTKVTFSDQPATNVSAKLEGLNPSTSYYFCWYAIDGSSEVQSNYGVFTTTSTSKPTFSEITVDSISENFMRLRCRVTDIGDRYLVEEGIGYRTKSNASADYIPVSSDHIDSNNEYTVDITDLSAATTYEIRPYAKNSSDSKGSSGLLEGYGETQTVTTESRLSPELESYDATDVTMNSARLRAKVTSAEGSYGVITERGFCYSTTSQTPTINDQTVVVSGTTLNEVYEATLTDLEQQTTYYVRPYAKNLVNWGERVGYGEVIIFTTSRFAAPQLSFINQSEVAVSATSITLQAQIDNYYPTALQERGFIWSTEDKNISIENAKSAGNYLTVSSSDKEFSGTMTNLEPSTNYYIRAYAIYKVSNETLPGLSDAVNYATEDLATGTFKTLTCTAKTTSSLTLNTGISDLGDGTLSEMGFIWRAGNGVTVTLENCDGSQTVMSEDSHDFSATITGLQQAIGYTVRGYVKTLYNWETLVAYSDALYCETNDFTAATVKDITCTAQTINSLTVESGITDLGTGTLVEKGFIYKNGNNGIPTLENNDGISKVDGNAQGIFSATITGLTYSSEYRVRSYVKTTLDGKTQVAYSGTITATTGDLIGVTFKASTCTGKTTSSLTVEGGITDLGDGEMTEKGFIWRVSDGVTPTLDNCDGSQASTDTSNDRFSYTISNLQAGTSYSVRPYVKSTYNWETFICYGDVITCETNTFTSATVKEITCSVQTISSLTVESGITELGNGSLVEKGFIYKTGNSGVPTLESYDGICKVEGAETSGFSATFTGLTYSTQYRVRSYVKTTLDGLTQVSYSNTITAATGDLTGVTFKTSSCTGKTTTSLTVESGITDLGDGELSEKGFLWRISDGVTPTLDNCDGSQASSDTRNDSFSYTISSLQAGTSYSVRPYVKSTYNWETFICYGDVITCETNNFTSATMKDVTCTAQTISSLTVESGITDLGTGTLVEKGFIWKAGNNVTPTLDNNDGSKVVNSTENGSFSVTITGLNYSTEYSIRGYVTTTIDGKNVTAYTNALTVATSDLTAATFNALTCTAQTTFSLTIEAGVKDLGDGELKEKGICWRVADGVVPSLDNCDGSQVSNETNYSSYTTEITGLQSATSYSVRAFVKTTLNWGEMIYYSDAVTFTTKDFSGATLKDVTLTSSTISSLSVESGITDIGNGTLIEKGFVYKAGNNGAPTLESCDGSLKVDGTSQSSFSATITGLTYSTDYRVRSYVKTSLEGKTQVSYSGVIIATTNDLTGVTFKTSNCTDQTTSSLTVESGITDLGDGEFAEKGFLWRVSDGVTPTLDNCDGSQVSNSASNDSFSCAISGLQSATAYSVRPYVKTTYNWEAFVSYGDVITCATNDYVAATLKDISCTAQSTTTLTVEGGITHLGNGTLEEKGFIWKTGNSGTPTLENKEGSLTVTSTENSAYSATISGLNPSTDYRIRGYVKTLIDGKSVTTYTNTITGSTNAYIPPTFTQPTSTTQTTSSLTIQAGIEGLGDGDVTEKGICWRTSDGVSLNLDNCEGSQLATGTSDTFTLTINGLNSGTTYTIRAYAKVLTNWETTVYYSEALESSTNNFVQATLKELTCTAQGTNSLTVETGISDMGNGTLVEKGFVWRVGKNVTPSLANYDGTTVSTDENHSAYTAVLNGLEAGTTYTIRAYVKTTLDNQEVVAYSNAITSTTVDYTSATMKKISCTAQTATSLTLESGITDMGNGELVEKGFLWREGNSGTPTLDNCDSSVKVESTDHGSYSATVNGLQVGTSYRLRGYAKTTIQGTTLVAYTDVITGTTKDKVSATMKSVSTSLTDDCTITASSGITNLGSGELIEKGFCWKMDGEPTLDDCDGYKAVTDGSESSYSASISGLHYSSTYYVRAYAKTKVENEILVSYSSTSTRKTKSISISYSAKIDETSIEIGMSCDNSLADKMSGWSVAIVKEGDNEIALNDNSYTSATKDDDTNQYVAKLTGLKANTSYVIRIRALYNKEYYIYQDTKSLSLLKTPSKGDIDNPNFK